MRHQTPPVYLQVIVVDVEDRDDSVWHNLSPFDGGLSGWRLLWDRYCPIPSWRYGLKLPRYQQVRCTPLLQGTTRRLLCVWRLLLG